MPARCNIRQSDHFTVAVTGMGAQELFALAAAQGIPLRGIRCAEDGYAATAQGRDLARLQALAARGGWRFTVTRRRGAGAFAERLLRRPGLVLGAVLCCVLLRALAGFVFAMDLSALDAAQQHELRGLLAQYGIREGCLLPQAKLMQAQQALSLNSDGYGWLSLNFAGGCLYVETSARERQSILTAPENTALYAKAGGEVLAVEVDSGFAAVAPGQYVAEGQLLAASVRADHSGSPVTQAAGGRVVARVEQTYTAAQPLTEQKYILTGRSTQADNLCLLGREWALHTSAGALPAALVVESWQPLHLGRVALPGSICCTEAWEQRSCTLTYSEATAAAMARRECRLLLAQRFPDAVVETQAVQTKIEDDRAVCTVRYVFTADIAAAQADRDETAP